MHSRGVPVRSALCLLALAGCMAPRVAAQETSPSHTERFAHSGGRLEDVERDVTAVLAGRPDDVDALLSRARIRMQLGKTEQALADFERASALAPARADVRAQLALAYVRLNRLTDAKFSADAALALEPQNSAANYTVGFLLLAATTDVDGAIQSLERSVLGNPVAPEIRFDLLRAYARRGDRIGATVQLRILRVLLPPGDARILHGEGLVAAQRGDLDTALRKFREAAAGEPKLAGAPMEGALAIARTLAVRGKTEQALALFRQAVQRFPESVEARHQLALALRDAGRTEEAAAQFAQAEQLSRKFGLPAAPSASKQEKP